MVGLLMSLVLMGPGTNWSIDLTLPSGRSKFEQFVLRARAHEARRSASVEICTELRSQGVTFHKTLEDTVSDTDGATVDYILPIRMSGVSYPGIAVRIRRPNWFDFHLWVATPDHIDEVFSFSCRDDKAVRWSAIRGKLVKIVSIDRYARVPERLKGKQTGKYRWVESRTLAWNPKVLRFVERSDSWQLMAFDKPLSPQGESLPGNFTFLWKANSNPNRL